MKKEKKREREIKKEEKKKMLSSLAGNRTPVFRVTGGDTHHYTTKDLDADRWLAKPPINSIV